MVDKGFPGTVIRVNYMKRHRKRKRNSGPVQTPRRTFANINCRRSRIADELKERQTRGQVIAYPGQAIHFPALTRRGLQSADEPKFVCNSRRHLKTAFIPNRSHFHHSGCVLFCEQSRFFGLHISSTSWRSFCSRYLHNFCRCTNFFNNLLSLLISE